jgi:hypothetical protein
MRIADLDFQTRSLRGGLWETCESGPIRPAPTLTVNPQRGIETGIDLQMSQQSTSLIHVYFFKKIPHTRAELLPSLGPDPPSSKVFSKKKLKLKFYS